MDSYLAMLTFARSHFVVGVALAQRFPTPEDWDAALNDGDLLTTLAEFDQVVEDVGKTAEAELDFLDMDSITELSASHYDRARESLESLAERLQVPVDDLVVLLMET